MEGATRELRQTLTSPPPGWRSSPGPPNQIPILHASLEYLRDGGDGRYLFLRTMLEVLSQHGFLNSSGTPLPLSITPMSGEEEQLLFHCANGLRHVVLMRWEFYSPSFRKCLRDFLLAVGLGLTTAAAAANADAGKGIGGYSPLNDNGSSAYHHLPRTVAMASLGCASSFWKRGWTGDRTHTFNGESTSVHENDQQSYLESLICNNLLPCMRRFDGKGAAKELFNYLHTLLTAPFEQQQQPTITLQQCRYTAAMSASFLSILVGEFALCGTSSARYNLSVEFHREHHFLFENGIDVNSVISVVSSNAVSVNFQRDSGLDGALYISMTALSSLVGYILNENSSNKDNISQSTVSTSHALQDNLFLDLGSSIIDVTCDVILWEFGAGSSTNKWAFSRDSNSSKRNNQSVLLRPPQRWRKVLIDHEFLGAIFNVYVAVRVGHDGISNTCGGKLSHLPRQQLHAVLSVAGGPPPANLAKRGKLAHLLRQLLLQLSSVASGPIFADEKKREAYAGFLLDGCLNMLETILNEQQQNEGPIPALWMAMGGIISAEIVDLVTILSRLTTNFGIKVLSQLPSFPRLLYALFTTGKWLVENNLAECERVEGDIESAEGMDWRNDAIMQILQCSDAMAHDYWLVSGTGGQEAASASQALASILAPLYEPYCICRVRMSCLEEHYVAREGTDVDEAQEDISAHELEEEMASASALGRLNLMATMTTLSAMFQQTMPRLMLLFEVTGMGNGDITPEIASLLEEARLLIQCACHLLTDDVVGETPAIPEAVINACRPGHDEDGDACTASIIGLIEMLKSVAEAQAMRVAAHPADPRLSPLLAKTLILFFRRWGPAYIFPSRNEHEENAGAGILHAYSNPETTQPVVSFCTTLCLLYFCHWPQEKEVQFESTSLLLAVAKVSSVRQLMVNSLSFEKIAGLHSTCASLRHNASPQEVSVAMAAIGGGLAIDIVSGYMRLPYADRGRVLTCLVVAYSEMWDDRATAMLNSCLKAVEAPFLRLIQALSNKQVDSKDINAQESACLSIFLFGGIILASEMSESERIPQFITPLLPQLSDLMAVYAEDLAICKGLLKLFCDYAERYILTMKRTHCLALFTASATLLRHYSDHHCKNRVSRTRLLDAIEEEFEEDQKYSDVTCAIQLLIHLSTKDLTDFCNTATGSSKDVATGQITDVIFFGLQQLLPLMAQGLLQFPSLCQHYFILVGFMLEKYPKRLCALPLNLFNSLLDSLLFGMSHLDPLVSKSSLQGLASLAREHLKTHALAAHLAKRGEIFENCTSRFLQEVIFQPIIWDRLESAGMALLPLAAIDVHKFIGLVHAISQKLGSNDQRHRLHNAFEKLIKPDLLAKAAAEGREGRTIHIQFKKDFDIFVRDVQSFLLRN